MQFPRYLSPLFLLFPFVAAIGYAENPPAEKSDPSRLTVQRIFGSGEFGPQ